MNLLGTQVGALGALPHLFLTKTLRGTYQYSPHLTDEETEAGKVSCQSYTISDREGIKPKMA